jgi:hypothetical protein
MRGTVLATARLALEVRAELGLNAYARLDPRGLAELYGVPVYPLEELPGWGCRLEAARHFADHRRPSFSAALVPVGDGMVIVENSTHSETRRRANICHEMAHVLLEHPFTRRTDSPAGWARDPGLEREADRLGGELLVPTQAALTAARDGASDEQVARRYRVSVSFARMRMNASGARIRAARERASRQRRHREAGTSR